MAENQLKLPSFAKINLHLRVLGKRDDGFHELCTVFQTVSLNDTLIFKKSKDLILDCNFPKFPTDERNLIIKAAKILQERFDVKKGARIYLRKKIPAPGGLGGGSSNAATTLLALAKLWEIEIGFAEFLEIGKQIGSDVPFFFFGGTALGAGRGTEIFPLPEREEKFILIITPKVNVSTAEAFSRLNAPRLTNQESKSILQICLREAETLNWRQYDLKNDFEASVFKIEPEIERVKERLFSLGANRALMTGSGASVFGIFDSEETRQTAIKAIENERNWRKFAVATVSRAQYREALYPCSSLLPISF
ncbi:MAG TPA: 4-(cytidine 5'-diphospho)-2-C-methyl-D-erythritol kinase [Pyrinomonadaceae bacterium]|nr:4-(cytidine 5'-diphospho)-2-C-methyl-D-erythritol kinase [Pyrinomonadaceae bacterium]